MGLRAPPRGQRRSSKQLSEFWSIKPDEALDKSALPGNTSPDLHPDLRPSGSRPAADGPAAFTHSCDLCAQRRGGATAHASPCASVLIIKVLPVTICVNVIPASVEARQQLLGLPASRGRHLAANEARGARDTSTLHRGAAKSGPEFRVQKAIFMSQ